MTENSFNPSQKRGQPTNKGAWVQEEKTMPETTLPAPAPTQQTDAPIEHTSMHAQNRQARELANIAIEGQMELSPEYQRGSVWSQQQRQGLIKSWLSGLPVPAIIVNVRGENDAWGRSPEHYYAVIDGKQRMETAIAWFSGELEVPASWFKPEQVETTIDTDDGAYVSYTGLSIPGQRIMAQRAMLPAIQVRADTIAEEAALYGLVNTSGTQQTAEDIANAERVANS